MWYNEQKKDDTRGIVHEIHITGHLADTTLYFGFYIFVRGPFDTGDPGLKLPLLHFLAQPLYSMRHRRLQQVMWRKHNLLWS